MPLETILDNKFGFMDVDHIAPRYINELAWWEYEEYVKRLNARIERDNKQKKETSTSNDNSGMSNYANKMPNMNSMMNNLGKYKP